MEGAVKLKSEISTIMFPLRCLFLGVMFADIEIFSFWLKTMDYNPSTGFSFGGLLACAVAASVWDTPYIGSDLLKEKLTCITFGQPHVSVEVTARLAMMRPEMAATLHAIYTQDDVVPRLMGLLDESWEARAKLEESSSQVGGAPPQLTGALAIVS